MMCDHRTETWRSACNGGEHFSSFLSFVVVLFLLAPAVSPLPGRLWTKTRCARIHSPRAHTTFEPLSLSLSTLPCRRATHTLAGPQGPGPGTSGTGPSLLHRIFPPDYDSGSPAAPTVYTHTPAKYFTSEKPPSSLAGKLDLFLTPCLVI